MYFQKCKLFRKKFIKLRNFDFKNNNIKEIIFLKNEESVKKNGKPSLKINNAVIHK